MKKIIVMSLCFLASSNLCMQLPRFSDEQRALVKKSLRDARVALDKTSFSSPEYQEVLRIAQGVLDVIPFGENKLRIECANLIHRCEELIANYENRGVRSPVARRLFL